MGKGINVAITKKDEYGAPIPSYPFVLTTDVDPKIVYAYCNGNGFWPPDSTTVYKSTDAGAAWIPVFFPDP